MQKEIKLMHVVKGLRLAGLEKVVVSLACNLKGFKQFVCVEDSYEGPTVADLSSELELHNIPVYYMQSPEKKAQRDLPLKYMKRFKSERIDIIHTHSGVWRDVFLGGKLARVPLHFHTEHGLPSSGGNLNKLTYRFLAKFSTQVIAVSNDLKTQLISHFDVPDRKVSVIPNGVDLARFTPVSSATGTLKNELHIEPNEKVIGIVGRLVPLKDHKTLIKAFASVLNKIPCCRLVIVGREDTSLGGVKEELLALAKDLGVTDKIIFTGERDDVHDMLRVFDVFALPSWTEGISISMLEAAATAKPLVATRVGGNSEIIQEGVNGFLVPPKDPQTLADRIIKILANDSLLSQMGKASREWVEKEFSLDVMVARYHKLYEFFLNKRKA